MAPSSESVVSLADLKAEFERFRDETNKNIADTSIQIAELRDILTDIQNRLPSSTPATSALVNTRRDPFAKLPVELTLLIATCAMHSEDCGDPQAWLKDFSHVCWSTRKAASMYLERHINPSRIDDFDATASACRAIQTWSPKRLDNVTSITLGSFVTTEFSKNSLSSLQIAVRLFTKTPNLRCLILDPYSLIPRSSLQTRSNAHEFNRSLGFILQGKTLSTIRKLYLNVDAHAIIKYCCNVETIVLVEVQHGNLKTTDRQTALAEIGDSTATHVELQCRLQKPDINIIRKKFNNVKKLNLLAKPEFAPQGTLNAGTRNFRFPSYNPYHEVCRGLTQLEELGLNSLDKSVSFAYYVMSDRTINGSKHQQICVRYFGTAIIFWVLDDSITHYVQNRSTEDEVVKNRHFKHPAHMDEDLSQQLQDAICDKIYQLLTTLFRHSHFRRLTIWVKSLAERKRKHAQHSQPRDSARRVCKIEFDMDVEPVGGQSAAALKLVEQDNDTSRDLLKGQLVVTPDVEGSSLIEPKKVAGFGLFADPEFHHLYTAAHQD